ncbi:MAG: hypothetical protein LW696_02845 [Alphaproteobacteria bacterium]|jgi:hypothetical protein|nr:hypothetical protein [Alphaproteobacteria bacterium]
MIHFRFLLIFSFVISWNSVNAVLFSDFLRPVSIVARKAIDRVTLPFPYSEVPSPTTRQAAFVYENFYTVLEDDAKKIGKKYAIVGTLRPCFFVGLRNDRIRKSVVFHKAAYSSLDSLVEIAKKELAIDGKAEKFLRGYIFSNRYTFYNYFPIDGKNTWRDLHQGKSQKEEMVFIKNFLISSFNISKVERLECRVFKNYLGHLASLSVLVDSTLELSSICLDREEIFGKCTRLGFEEDDVLEERYKRAQELRQIYFDDKLAPTYNSLPFERAPLHYFE